MVFFVWLQSTFTSWYMIGTSIKEGVHRQVWTAAPVNGVPLSLSSLLPTSPGKFPSDGVNLPAQLLFFLFSSCAFLSYLISHQSPSPVVILMADVGWVIQMFMSFFIYDGQTQFVLEFVHEAATNLNCENILSIGSSYELIMKVLLVEMKMDVEFDLPKQIASSFSLLHFAGFDGFFNGLTVSV